MSQSEISLPSLKQFASIETGMLQKDFYLLYNGKILNVNTVQNGIVHIVPRIWFNATSNWLG